ncbi:hypothetical protein E2320_022871, partial [Naja naja]
MESPAMILEWRAATGPIGPMGDHNEPAEWQYQTAMCSQTFKDLPDELEQLIIGREGRGQQRRQMPTWRDVVGRIISSQKRVIYHCWRSTFIILFTPESGRERDQSQMMPAQAAAPPPPPQPVPRANAPTPFKTMFEGTASNLAFFLNRAWSYIDRHGVEFHYDAQLVQFLGDNLEEAASEWFTQLNYEGAPELNNVDDFLREL